MNIGDIADLDLVADDLEGQHEKLDEGIRRVYPFTDPEYLNLCAPHILMSIAEQSGLKKYCNLTECQRIIDSEPRLRDMILNSPKNGYKSVRLLKLLRPEPALKDGDHPRCSTSGLAHEVAWEEPYVGPGATALWAHIQEWFCEDVESDPNRLYPKYSALIQSSGMGKSRTVDEMSRFHFVIPVNLRGPNSSGYPPSDTQAYNYLSHSPTQREAFLRSCSFLHALFHQTILVLQDIKKQKPIAAQFWEYMREGMEHGAHGPLRKRFYADVIADAQGVYSMYSQLFAPECQSNRRVDDIVASDMFPLRHAFHDLRTALEESKSTPDIQPSKRSKSEPFECPLVVLAFDEVHTLTHYQDLRTDHPWSRFGELRRAIRGLILQPLFTLFLSTSGTLFSITHGQEHNISVRTDVMVPFTELGFDQYAVHVDFSSTVKLSQVTSEEHLASYGRPLWARPTYKDKVTRFAALKLLGGTAYQGQVLSAEQRLACLAQRVPIEFLSAVYASQVSDLEKELVYAHMRVILKAGDDLETMITASPSEPVLSEAAYFLMTNQGFNAPQALQDVLNRFAVDKSELGNLIAALLFTMARDEAVGRADYLGRPPNDQRWCSLAGLLTSLFCTPRSASDDHVNVVTSHGWRCTAGKMKRLKSSLAKTFKDSKVYFTHFVKAHQCMLIGVDYLMRLMARGAAVLCVHGQTGVDGIIPFLLEGDEIRRNNIGVIMFQVMNDESYTNVPEAHVFHGMNPRSLGVMSPSADIPVIRIVFALAAKTPRLALVRHMSNIGSKESFKTYDFWVGGLSSDLLVPVMNEQGTWDSILEASHVWRKIYSDRSKLRAELRKSMNPGTAVEREFWGNWCDHVSPD